MRLAPVYFFISFFFLSCQNRLKENGSSAANNKIVWTEEQKRDYFADSLAFRYDLDMERDSTKTFQYFFKSHYPDIKTKYVYDAFTYAFEEDYIDATAIDTSKRWFRLMVKPCFRLPYCFVVEKKHNRAFLTTKITNGDGGYYTGNLIVTMKFPFEDSLFNNLFKNLTDLGFWSLPSRDTACHGGLDGETWTFESIEKGRYNIVNRWVPQACGNKSTKLLAQIGLRFKELSELDKILIALGARKS